MSEQEANSCPVPTDVLLKQLKGDRQAMMLRKVARKMQSTQPNRVLNTLVAIMGDDPEPLPRTPTFQHTNNYTTRGRGRGRGGVRGRGARVNIRGPRYEHSNQNAWRNRNPQEREPKAPVEQKPFHGNNMGKVDTFPKEKKAIENPRFEVENAKIPQRESMQDFFKDIETLPDAERNRMIQVCIKELIEENKLLRDANRKLVQKQRVYPSGLAFEPQDIAEKQEEPRLHPADVRQKSKNLNVHAAEFEMSSEASAAAMAPLPHELYENQNLRMGADTENLRYEDFVRMRRKERNRHEYEDMVAEQMYLEEMEMRRFQELEMEMYAQGPPYEDRYDPRFADPRFYDDMAYQPGNYY